MEERELTEPILSLSGTDGGMAAGTGQKFLSSCMLMYVSSVDRTYLPKPARPAVRCSKLSPTSGHALGAAAALAGLVGRQFAGRIISGNYYDEAAFGAGAFTL